MNEFPIFLLPKGEIMMTAKVVENEIQLLKKTIFPSNKRYDINYNGFAVCLDNEKEIIICGRLTFEGDMESIEIIEFPSMINPKSIKLVKNNIFLGGESSHEIIVSYSISNKKFIPIEVPVDKSGKNIDDFLLNKNRLIAVDNLVYPKYLIEYDVKNPDSPYLIWTHELPENGTYESIIKGSFNNDYIALLSSTFGLYGTGEYINVFMKTITNSYTRLSNWFGNDKKEDNIEMCSWRDIFIPKKLNALLISSDDKGIGIYEIIVDISKVFVDDTDSIIYFNKWGKSIKKILPVPNNDDIIILIFDDSKKDNLSYSYGLCSIEEIETIIKNSSSRRFS